MKNNKQKEQPTNQKKKTNNKTYHHEQQRQQHRNPNQKEWMLIVLEIQCMDLVMDSQKPVLDKQVF